MDTNVILDILLKREDYYKESVQSIQKAINNGDRLFFSASSATDVFYIINKHNHDSQSAIMGLRLLTRFLSFASVSEKDLFTAIMSSVLDFEDAVVDSVANSIQADLILSRNVKDFVNSKVKVQSPKEYLAGA